MMKAMDRLSLACQTVMTVKRFVVAPRATRNRRNRTPVKSYTLESDGEASVIELSEDEEYV